MTKSSRSYKALPGTVALDLQKLGMNIAIARKRRRLSRKNLAERVMVSVETIQRLEKGDPTVGIGIIATALWVLGISRHLGDLISPESDTVGLQEDIRHLPRDFRKSKKSTDDYNF